MNKFFCSFLTGIIIMLVADKAMYAQVRIGSGLSPAPGALLDLKEDRETRKGLGLPKVNLLHLQIPNLSTNLSLTIDQADGVWNKDEHIGLLVYHIGEYDRCDSESIKNGAYSWNGDTWLYVGHERLKENKKDVLLDVRDNEEYHYAHFGDAGYWMLENMRFIDAQVFTQGFGGFEIDDKYYIYPNASDADPISVPSTWRKQQGLLYSYSAATLGAQDALGEETEDQGQGGSDEASSEMIQGICPQGWHIPTDREWNELEKELYNNPTKYSSYTSNFTNPTTWNPSWEVTQDGPRGTYETEGHGRVFLSTCFPVGGKGSDTERITGGKSLSYEEGGMDILLTGASDIETSIRNYGSAAAFWSSSRHDTTWTAWMRIFYGDDVSEIGSQTQQVVKSPVVIQTLASVRCKRN